MSVKVRRFNLVMRRLIEETQEEIGTTLLLSPLLSRAFVHRVHGAESVHTFVRCSFRQYSKPSNPNPILHRDDTLGRVSFREIN